MLSCKQHLILTEGIFEKTSTNRKRSQGYIMKIPQNDERIGTIAAFLTSPALIPQAIAIWKNLPQPAENISALAFTILSAGIAMWLWYGCRIKKKPIIWANSVSLLITLSILIYKLLYG